MQPLSKKVLWLNESSYQPDSPLESDEKVDIAIIGGGMAGLWSAFLLMKENHGLKVAILEADEIGHGASGRSAGFITSSFHRSLYQLVKVTGKEEARNIYDAATDAMDLMADTINDEGIKCELNRNCGLVRSSNMERQDARIKLDLRIAEKLGIGNDFLYLDRESLQSRLHSERLRCGYFQKKASLLNPAKLVFGLKQRLRELGCKFYENTPVVDWHEKTHSVTVRTRLGTIWADRVIVCGNAYTKVWKPMQSDVFSVYSYACATPILADREWDLIGWEQREGWEDKRFMNLYFRPTADGRILWGGHGTGMFMGDPHPSFDQVNDQLKRLRQSFNWLFPQLKHVPFEFHWGGAIGLTSNALPNVGFSDQKNRRVAHAFGFNGRGIAASFMAAHIIRDLFASRNSAWTDLYFVNRPQMNSSQRLIRNAAIKAISRSERKADELGKPRRKPLLLKVLDYLGVKVPEVLNR